MISIKRAAIKATLICVLMSSCTKEAPKPMVEENIFINEVYASGVDWIEIYNANLEPKDISGYFIYDDPTNSYAIPAGTIIPAKGFLILFCDDTATGLHTNFRLTEKGEIVYLQNKLKEVIDRVEFPALREGQSYGRYPDGSTTFIISGKTSQGITNEGSQAPAISKVSHEPLVPGLSSLVTVKVEFVSSAAISTVKLAYRFNTAGYTEVILVNNGTSYSGTIPAQNANGKIEYYIEAKNTSGLSSRDPYDAPLNVNSYLLNSDVLPALYINEFMASNMHAVQIKAVAWTSLTIGLKFTMQEVWRLMLAVCICQMIKINLLPTRFQKQILPLPRFSPVAFCCFGPMEVLFKVSTIWILSLQTWAKMLDFFILTEGLSMCIPSVRKMKMYRMEELQMVLQAGRFLHCQHLENQTIE